MKQIYKVLSVSFYDLLQFQKDGQLWNPYDMPPFDEITKVYVAAVQYHNKQYLCSNDVSSTHISAEKSRLLPPTENIDETLPSPAENVGIAFHTPTDNVD
eukprot:2058234-Ditylum_brightwellii.AAC.1